MTSEKNSQQSQDKAVAIVSGGMDSTVLAYALKDAGWDLHMLSFDYGQRHKKEIQFARDTATDLNAVHVTANMDILDFIFAGSALTDLDSAVPEGHYSDDTMKDTVVPNRNMTMLSLATSYAVSIGASRVFTAVHAGDHPVYPDCRPEFIEAVSRAAQLGTEGFSRKGFRIAAPFSTQTKEDIARTGHSLGVPFEKTWSCYKGGEKHCGRCSTCVERIEALYNAGLVDRTGYEDAWYWKGVVEKAGQR